MRNLLRWCVLLVLCLVPAFATPTPQDVDREIRAGRYDQALILLADVRKERPLSATAEWLTASALYGKGDVQEAGAHLAAARQLDPALSGAAPARVAQIEGALRGQERASFGRTLALVLGALFLVVLAGLLIRRVRRDRQRRAARAEALDGLFRRVKVREDEIEAEQFGLKVAALTDPSAQDRLRALEDELNTLYATLTEVQDGPVEAMAAYPGPRPRRPRRASSAPSAQASPRSSGAAASSTRPGPAMLRLSSAAPVTVVQGGSSSGDLLSGVMLGQALVPSPAPEPARPAPVPERRVEAAPASWENPSSLSGEDRKPSWEAPSSLSSGASDENTSSLSSSSSDSTPSSTDTSSSSSSDTSSTSSSDW